MVKPPAGTDMPAAPDRPRTAAQALAMALHADQNDGRLGGVPWAGMLDAYKWARIDDAEQIIDMLRKLDIQWRREIYDDTD